MTETDIPPGGEGKIEVTFDSGRKKGQQKKTITVESNDPANPMTRLYVSALIEIQFGFESYSLDFGRIRKGEPATKMAVLVLKDLSKSELLQLESKSPHMSVRTVGSASSDDGRLEVEVTLNPNAPVGRFTESVTASLADNSHPASTLRISGTVDGNVELTPKTVRFTIDTTKAAADQPVQQIRVASTQDDANLQILEVEDNDGRLTFEVAAVTDGRQYVVRAKPNEKAMDATRNVSGEIKISTNDTDQPMLTCRYAILIPRR